MTSASAGAVIDPVCGMTVDPAKTKFSLVHGTTTYYFCGKGCYDKFSADPERWLTRAASQPTQSLGETSTIDPVCGMTVDPAKAKLSLVHGTTTYYFCGKSCYEKFSADPERWLARANGTELGNRDLKFGEQLE